MMDDLHDIRKFYKRTEKRIIFESDVMKLRSNRFLIINGLGAAAVGMSVGKLWIMAVVVMIALVLTNFLWLAIAFQSWKLISSLRKGDLDAIPESTVDNSGIYRKIRESWGLRPMNLMCLFIPVLVQAGWNVGIIVANSI